MRADWQSRGQSIFNWRVAVHDSRKSPIRSTKALASQFPLDPVTWREVLRELGLPPQQARIVELILRRQSDQQIAVAMKIRVPTVRTYLGRIFARTGTSDRLDLVLRILTISQDIIRKLACHRAG